MKNDTTKTKFDQKTNEEFYGPYWLCHKCKDIVENFEKFGEDILNSDPKKFTQDQIQKALKIINIDKYR